MATLDLELANTTTHNNITQRIMTLFFALTFAHLITGWFLRRHLIAKWGHGGPGFALFFVPVLGWFTQWMLCIGMLWEHDNGGSHVPSPKEPNDDPCDRCIS